MSQRSGSVGGSVGGNFVSIKKKYFVDTNRDHLENLVVTAEQSLRIPQHTMNKYADSIRGRKGDKAAVITQALVKRYFNVSGGWEVKQDGILFLVDTYDNLSLVLFDVDNHKKCWDCEMLSKKTGKSIVRQEKQGERRLVLTGVDTNGFSFSTLWDISKFMKDVTLSIEKKGKFIETIPTPEKKKSKKKKKKKKKGGWMKMSVSGGQKIINQLPKLALKKKKVKRKKVQSIDEEMIQFLEDENDDLLEREDLEKIPYEKQILMIIEILSKKWRDRIGVKGVEYVDNVTIFTNFAEKAIEQHRQKEGKDEEEEEGEGEEPVIDKTVEKEEEEEQVKKVVESVVSEVVVDENVKMPEKKIEKVEEIEEEEEIKIVEEEETIVKEVKEEEEEEQSEWDRWVIGEKVVIPEYPVNFLDEIKTRLEEIRKDRGFEELQFVNYEEED